MKKLLLRIGMILIYLGKSIQPAYWMCDVCGNIEYYEREIRCWKCGLGEMLYKGTQIYEGV